MKRAIRERRGVIYKITNLVNGKAYFGQTIQGINIRWSQHVSYSKTGNTILSRAIRKYGHDNFSIKKTAYGKNRKELNSIEKQAIANFKKQNGKDHCYNISAGGWGGQSPTKKLSAEHRSKISEALRKLPKRPKSWSDKISTAHKGKKLSLETKKKMSESRRGEKNSFYGKRHSAETKKIIGIKSQNRNWTKGSAKYNCTSVDRAAFVILYFQKFCINEIAEKMGITNKVAHRVRKELCLPTNRGAGNSVQRNFIADHDRDTLLKKAHNMNLQDTLMLDAA